MSVRSRTTVENKDRVLFSPAYIASPAHTKADGFRSIITSHRLFVKFWLLHEPNAILVDSLGGDICDQWKGN